MGTIDRRSAVPFYSQLKDLIIADIAARGLEPGDRIPGDFDLCEEYDVSRTVVRQALRDLEIEGFVRRERGRGTFVASGRRSAVFGHALIGSFEDIQSGSGTQHTTVLRRGLVPAGAQVAADLGLTVGAEVVEIERLRSVDGKPWALTRTQLPREIGGGLLDTNLDDVSLFGVLEREFGIRFDHANRSVEAEVVPPDVAIALGIGRNAPVLVMRSVSFDAYGRPLERFTGFHRGDLSRLEIDVRRNPNTEVDIL
jgi:GntR family transcriptional regulator